MTTWQANKHSHDNVQKRKISNSIKVIKKKNKNYKTSKMIGHYNISANFKRYLLNNSICCFHLSKNSVLG